MSVRFPYSPARTPPIPAIVVTLLAPAGSRHMPNVSAPLDTAADRTLIPLPLLQQLGLTPVRQLSVRGLGSSPMVLDVYAIEIDIPGLATVKTEALTHGAEPFVLIGRDILNLFHVSFHGPNRTVEFH